MAAAQNDPEVAETFRAVWMVPRRADAKAGLERHRGRELREDADLDLVMDALYGPLYFRLLAGHRPPDREVHRYVDIVLEGLRKR